MPATLPDTDGALVLVLGPDGAVLSRGRPALPTPDRDDPRDALAAALR